MCCWPYACVDGVGIGEECTETGADALCAWATAGVACGEELADEAVGTVAAR